MNPDVQKFIDMLKAREDGMREHIAKEAANGNNEARVHYIGWLRGIQGSRTAAEVVVKDIP